MRSNLEGIQRRDPSSVERALRQAALYIDVHFSSVRRFGGGKKR
jgi:hypothetical protein